LRPGPRWRQQPDNPGWKHCASKLCPELRLSGNQYQQRDRDRNLVDGARDEPRLGHILDYSMGYSVHQHNRWRLQSANQRCEGYGELPVSAEYSVLETSEHTAL